jgi:hypothetical protein
MLVFASVLLLSASAAGTKLCALAFLATLPRYFANFAV